MQFEEIVFSKYSFGKTTHVYLTVTVRPRHLRVDQGDDLLRPVRCRFRYVDGDSHRTKPMLIGKRNLDDGRVDSDNFLTEEQRDLAQENRYILYVIVSDKAPEIAANEKTVDREAGTVFR